MTQNVDDKNELHDFNDIEPRELRAYNRGAVLANIHETYTNEGKISGQAIEPWLAEINSYLGRMPAGEQQEAKDAMKTHLIKRGIL